MKQVKFRHSDFKQGTLYTAHYNADGSVLVTWDANGTERSTDTFNVIQANNYFKSGMWIAECEQATQQEPLLERIKRFTEATNNVVCVTRGKFEVVASNEVYTGLSDGAVVELMDALEVVKKYE
jgi:hypothetical protein